MLASSEESSLLSSLEELTFQVVLNLNASRLCSGVFFGLGFSTGAFLCSCRWTSLKWVDQSKGSSSSELTGACFSFETKYSSKKLSTLSATWLGSWDDLAISRRRSLLAWMSGSMATGLKCPSGYSETGLLGRFCGRPRRCPRPPLPPLEKGFRRKSSREICY